MSAFSGTWAGGSVITENGDTLHITMGSRPAATGKLLNQNTASVNFPDGQTWTATLVNRELISWSNGTTWNRITELPNEQNSQVQEILDAHNKYRAEVGLSALTWSNNLANSAQQWANNLAATSKFGSSALSMLN